MRDFIFPMNVNSMRVHRTSGSASLGVPGIRSASNPAENRWPLESFYGGFSTEDVNNLQSPAAKTLYTYGFSIPNEPFVMCHLMVLAYNFSGSKIVYYVATDLDKLEKRINRMERVDSATDALGELFGFVFALPASLLSVSDLKKANPIPDMVTRFPRRKDLEAYLGSTYRIVSPD